MHTDRQQWPPQPRHHAADRRNAEQEPPEIAVGDGQNVAEQIAHQVEPRAADQGRAEQPGGKGGMGEDAEQRIVGQQLLALHPDQQPGERERNQDDAHRQVDAEQDAERDAEQAAMGNAVAEHGEPLPDDEAAKRRGQKSDAEPGETGAQEKIVNHGYARSRRRL